MPRMSPAVTGQDTVAASRPASHAASTSVFAFTYFFSQYQSEPMMFQSGHSGCKDERMLWKMPWTAGLTPVIIDVWMG